MKFYIHLFIFCFSISKSYSQVQVNELSHYLFPEFTKGIVLMKNGKENKALLNYNSLTEEMIFKDKGKFLAIGPTEIQLIDTIFIKDRKFCILNNAIVELIIQSEYDLFAENKCKALNQGQGTAYGGTSQTSATSSYGSINSGGSVNNLNISEDYKFKPYTHYWLRRNGKLKKFTSIRQLMKIYNDKKELFKAYIKKNDVKFDNQESIVLLIEYMEVQ